MVWKGVCLTVVIDVKAVVDFIAKEWASIALREVEGAWRSISAMELECS